MWFLFAHVFLSLISFLVPSSSFIMLYYVILAGSQLIGDHTEYFVLCGLGGIPSLSRHGVLYGAGKCTYCKIFF